MKLSEVCSLVWIAMSTQLYVCILHTSTEGSVHTHTHTHTNKQRNSLSTKQTSIFRSRRSVRRRLETPHLSSTLTLAAKKQQMAPARPSVRPHARSRSPPRPCALVGGPWRRRPDEPNATMEPTLSGCSIPLVRPLGPREVALSSWPARAHPVSLVASSTRALPFVSTAHVS